jgi:Chromo (CHRromatin Organisation MOdifier) domain
VAYKLELPHQWTIHPVFHASLLTPYVETKEHSPNYSRPPPDLIGGKEQYEVKAIWSHRHHGRTRQLQYLLKWKGYPESDNMWEAAMQVHSPELVKQYHRWNPLNNIKAALLV